MSIAMLTGDASSERPRPPFLRATTVRLVVVIAVSLALPRAAGASGGIRPAASGSDVRPVSLGDGTYEVVASLFGTAQDGLVGNQTASGHILQPRDHLVALPACTESSCPWVPLGTGTSGHWGPQTSCAEDDGECWVEIVSLDTGVCAVAPVLDLGPLFVHDNWWAPWNERTYPLDQGVPAAEAAAAGADLGFGPGISDRGYDVAHTFHYGAGIDIAEGTWRDLGLATGVGVSRVRVTMLWQAGIGHQDACGGGGAAAIGDAGGTNAAVAEALNLRAGPSLSAAILTVMPGGSRVAVEGGATGDFYPVRYGGQEGWAAGDYLQFDGGNPGPGETVAVTTDRVNLRAGPSLADDVLGILPAGSLVVLTGDAANGFQAVSVAGAAGWVFADYLDVGSGSGAAGEATTTDNLNLRAGPSTDDAVLAVMPQGATVTLTGAAQGGFLAVRYAGQAGWAAAAYLDVAGFAVATATDNVNLRSGPSLDGAVRGVIPAGATVALTGDRQNGFVAVSYQGVEGWAYGAYLE